MTVSLSPILNGFQSFTSAGLPNSGGFLYTYAAGTSTLQTTYTASNGSTPNANPIVFDSAGRAPQEIWLTDGLAYKLVVADSTTAPIAGCTYDNISSAGSNILATQLAASSGSSLIGFIQAGIGAVFRTVQAKLRDTRTVEDWGALGDGATNDQAAFLAMAVATNGIIRMLDKEYFVSNMILPAYDKVTVTGIGMPKANAALTQMQTGSIVLGGVAIFANTVHLKDFGVDNGSARGLSGVTDILVVNAKTGEQGIEAALFNIASLGPTSAGTTHSILVQGYGRGRADNIYCSKNQFGLVVKCRNFEISNVSGDDIRTALVYPKSDIPAYAGNVADGTANNFEITNVSHRSVIANTEASAVYLHASTAVFASARIANVFQVYGMTALRIQGGGLITDPTISGIRATNIRGERSTYAVFAGGYTYDWGIVNVEAVNTTGGIAVYMDTNAYSWNLNGVHNTVSDGAITGANLMSCFGIGQFTGVTVRNPARIMTVTVAGGSLPSIKTGVVSGDCIILNEGTLTPLNAATNDATYLPTLKILPASCLKLSGRFNLTASSNKAFCNLPINTGKQMIFACGGIDSGGNYVSATVRLNDFQLTFEPSIPVGYQRIDLTGITIPL